jgi:CRISPR-associated exonuclease Cas4
MERGRDVQAAVEALERRRTFRAYGVGEGERHFGVWLSSERLGLSGKLDLLIVTADACFPVDFKDTEGGLRRNHRMQLAAYALLAEETFRRPVPEAFVFLVPHKKVVAIELNDADRQHAEDALADMRRMIAREDMPPPTTVRGRCQACGFRNFCGDVW